MPTSHLDTGRDGEETVAAHLQREGYRILERNVRFGRDEIDMIAYDEQRAMTVFVEVKARSVSSTNYPVSTAVDKRKRRCLSRAVSKWSTKNDFDGPGRIDVVCVAEGRVVQHIMDLGSDFY